MITARMIFKQLTTLGVVTAATMLLSLAACNKGGDEPGSASLSLFAGNVDSQGNVDGTGLAARFYDVRGGAFDTAGNYYVADTGSHTIRKITAAGVVTTFAGLSGYPGNTNGVGALARFNTPYAVATDKANPSNIYVADTNNHSIRKISPAGDVTTLAGTGSTLFADTALGVPATFSSPQGIATDTANNVYVADTMNHRIRKILPDGTVSTLAGTGASTPFTDNVAGATATFSFPQGIAIDSANNVYVGDTGNHRIRKIVTDANGIASVSTLAGTGTTGKVDSTTGTSASFSSPQGVATDSLGFVYVADTGNRTIRKINTTGTAPVVTLAGATDGSFGYADGGATAKFYLVNGLAVDSANNVFVTDYYNRNIRKIVNGTVSTFAGKGGAGTINSSIGTDAAFNFPTSVVSDSSGNFYVADQYNHTIRKISPTGAVSLFAGKVGEAGSADTSGNVVAQFNYPAGVAMDKANNLYVADTNNHTIRKIPTTGTFAGVVTTLAGTPSSAGYIDGGSGTKFSAPVSLAVDSKSNIFVVDRGNHVIRKVDQSGLVTSIAGASAGFYYPFGITIDSADNIFVSDQYNHTIRKITPAGDVITIAGKAGDRGNRDGGAVARFNYPAGIASDGLGNVYVSDSQNHTIRKVTSAGIVTTVVGEAGKGGFAPGALPGLVAFPNGLAFVGSSLYIVMSHGVAVVKNIR